MTHFYNKAPAPWDYSMLRIPMILANILSVNQCRNNALFTLKFKLLENAPCVECMDKGLCFLLNTGKLTPLFFHSSLAWYAWLLYYKNQQFFLECVIMHECNNNFAFPSHSAIYTAILNIHCFFLLPVYKFRNWTTVPSL